MEQKIKHIVRVANVDLKGDRPVGQEMQRIYGVNRIVAGATCKLTEIPPTTRVGLLTEEHIKKIETTLKGDQFPRFLLNIHHDVETGKDMHLIGPHLKLHTDFDKKRLQKIKAYRGLRLQAGLPARGQRTRSNFRKGRSLGVQKSKVKAGKS